MAEQQLFLPLVHSQKSCNIEGCARLKPGAGNFFTWALSCCCCPGTVAGSEMGNRVAMTRIGAVIWGASMGLGIAASPLNKELEAKTTAGAPYRPSPAWIRQESQFRDPQNLCFCCSVLATAKTMVARNTGLIALLPYCLLLVFLGASWTEYQRAESLV